MKLLKHILLSLLLLTSSIGFTQNNLIKSGTNLLKVGNNLITIPFNQYSMTFDGVDEYVNTATIANGFSGITVSAWIYINTFGNYDGVVYAQAGIDFNGLDLWNNNNINFTVNNGTTNKNVATPNSSISTGQWYHVVGTWNTGEAPIIYLDNSATVGSSGTLSGTLQVTDIFKIGFDDGQVGRLFDGYIDEVSIWNIGLTTLEVSELFNSGSPTNLLKHSAAANLVGWWRMGDRDTFDGSNWTLIDNAKSNNGTSVNMEFIDRTHRKP